MTANRPQGRFFRNLRRGFAVLPLVGDGINAMSAAKQAKLLDGLDPTVVLEAASTVLAEYETGQRAAVMQRLPIRDRDQLVRWYRTVEARDENPPAPVPVHPIAVLAATTLALGQSRSGVRTDAERERVAGLLTQVALRLNRSAVEGNGTTVVSSLALMCRSSLWRAVESQEWMAWSAELVNEIAKDPDAAALLDSFEQKAGLTIVEWWYRGIGERSTRAMQGAGSWGGTVGINPRIENAWAALVSTTVDDAIEAARQALTRRRRNDDPTIADPFDLSWLAKRPIVRTADGRRFQVWLGANNRCLLPASIAQVLADTTGTPYSNAAERIGRAAERLLTAHVDAGLPCADEIRLPEAAMPPHLSKCDYLIEYDGVLLGIEFTIATPSRALSSGDEAAVQAVVGRYADKVEQIYSAFAWHDPDHRLRWLPLLVLNSPGVVDPLLNERIHDELSARRVVPVGSESDLMTCHAPDFLDLVEYTRSIVDVSLVDAVKEWRDGSSLGTALDWWLSDRGGHGCSGRKRAEAAFAPAEAILSKSLADDGVGPD